jgi:hypothetical protein
VIRTIRLEGADQTTVILVEDDFVALQAFFGDPRNEDIDNPDAVMTYDAFELAWLVQAMTQAGAFLAGLKADFFSCMRGECDESCAFRPGPCRGGGTAEGSCAAPEGKLR